nr:unnamed protein product [Callosobruchus chinensis]
MYPKGGRCRHLPIPSSLYTRLSGIGSEKSWCQHRRDMPGGLTQQQRLQDSTTDPYRILGILHFPFSERIPTCE